ncbi:MAG: DUF4097 family beta strand repeat protein [Firmicutes bacterium]|nr:DUF4097 family beta strand repeat protein [Bacillota bacterium]
MNEERFLILKMVEEGKITAQEAVALISALEESPVSHGDWVEDTVIGEGHGDDHRQWSTVKGLREAVERAGDSEFTRRLEEEANRFAKNVEEAADKLSRVIEERIERDVRPALANLPSFLATIPVIGEWVGHFSVITEEREGRFAGDDVHLELATENGAIELEGWTEDYYRLILKKKVRGNDDQSARERAAEIVEIQENDEGLRIISHAGPNEALHVKLSVPKDKRYRLSFGTSNGQVYVASLGSVAGSISTTNGKVELRELQGERLTARTSNGSVECLAVNVQELILATSNGRIKAGSTFAQRLEASTSNGSIMVSPQGSHGQGQSLDLHTSNGGIHVKLPPELQNACWLDASSSFGAIKAELEGLQYFIKENSFGYNRVQAETQGFAAQDGKISIYARTSNGSISIEKS